jgi:hypothetical protein
MKTIAQELNITDFPFQIEDSKGKLIYTEEHDNYWLKSHYDDKGVLIYYENSEGIWAKWEYDSQGNEIYYENSDGKIIDNRPQSQAEPMTIEIDGKKYKLTEI